MDGDLEIRIEPGAGTPLWRQIEEGVRRAVASGRLEPGRAVPSVRELAVRLMVNPATVARAYRRLMETGLLEVRRGEGTFVARAVGERLGELREREISRAAARYAGEAAALGVDVEAACRAVREAWPGETAREDGDGGA